MHSPSIWAVCIHLQSDVMAFATRPSVRPRLLAIAKYFIPNNRISCEWIPSHAQYFAQLIRVSDDFATR